MVRSARAFLVASIAFAGLWACGGSPAQIVDYSPLRGTQNVATVEPVRITFDHAVDKASVTSRLRLSPAVEGSIKWLSDQQLEYDHLKLDPSTLYEVILDAGYSDNAGNVYMLRHHWSFTTEAPPSFAGSSPTDGATRIDPADYLSIGFTRSMNADSLRSALAFIDPTDDRRVIVAPEALLAPNTDYSVLVGAGALDADGNQLDRVRTIRFTTGDVSKLRHWIAFATLSASGSSGGLWIVNETGFPRQLLSVSSIQSFSWSPDGSGLVFETEAGSWVAFAPGREPEQLDFSASWASALTTGAGYVYLDSSGTLHRELADRSSDIVATDVAGAAVSPDGSRLAYSQPQTDGSTVIWGYDVGLRTHYVLAVEKSEVTGLSWAPAGNRLAYLRSDATSTALRVLGLAGSASTTTIATGELGAPIWLRDSDHVLVAATVKGPDGPIKKAFVINVAAPPPALTYALGLPSDPAVAVSDPVPSPDGHQVAFISGNQVWLMNADGTRPTPLTRYDQDSFPYSCLIPAWTRS